MVLGQRYSLAGGKPLRLVGQVQRYAWGKVGAASRIAPFIGDVGAGEPLAEYWIGCHPKGCAQAILPDGSRCSLAELLEGQESLPFMLKVLSINPAYGLSIQSHPDAAVARRLHERDPEHYPDPHHKPELGIALSPVTLLYDIRPARALRQISRNFPEIISVLSEGTKRCLAAFDSRADELALELKRGMFTDCITADEATVRSAVTAILARYDGHSAKDVPEEIVTMRRLVETHGFGDVGLVALLLMNRLELQPGEGIFIGPNTPHAYLDGDLVECMACSDNVIRAGLTNKFRDVATLVETTNFGTSPAPHGALKREVSPHQTEFIVPAQEFGIRVIHAHAHCEEIRLVRGNAVALCVGDQAVISCGGGADLVLRNGEAALVPDGTDGVCVSTESAQVFLAEGASPHQPCASDF